MAGLTVARFLASACDAGCIKFGEFTLKSGKKSPIYVDFRGLPSVPKVLRQAAACLMDVIRPLERECVAGLPYAGLPLAVALATEFSEPAVYPRKEAKEHGTGKMVEGIFELGNHAVVVDDVITDAGTKLEMIRPLLDAGLFVNYVAVLVDREQGGREALEAQGIELRAVCTLSELAVILKAAGKMSPEQYDQVWSYVAENRTK